MVIRYRSRPSVPFRRFFQILWGARAAIAQAEENLRVTRSRYLQQRGTNTEVLDAESARVQNHDNYFNALHDAFIAGFDLRRAVGDI